MTDRSAQLAALDSDRRRALEQLLLQRANRARGIAPRDHTRPAPLSPPQRRLWFLDQLTPGAPTYNAIVTVRARGRLDLELLRRALVTIVERHEVLRSALADVDGVATQRPLAQWQLRFERDRAVDLPAAVSMLREFAREPYDLARDVTLRVKIVELAPDDVVIGFAEHHIAFDGWSDEVLFAELSAGYAALRDHGAWTPEPLALQYADIAAWLDARAVDPRHAEYWRRQLAGAPAAVRLPVDHAHPDRPRHAGRHVAMRVPGALDNLRAIRSHESATSFIVLSAALAAAVFRWSGEADLVVGSPFANRGRAELEPLIGFFSNTVPLRLRMAVTDTFRDLVRQARGVIMDAFEHQELPFERIVELSAQERDPRRNPVFQVNVRVQQGAPVVPTFDGVDVVPVEVDLGFSRFDLAVDLSVPAGDGAGAADIAGYLEYNEDLFEPATIATLVGWFEVFVADCLRRPDTPLGSLRFGPATGAVRGRRRAATQPT